LLESYVKKSFTGYGQMLLILLSTTAAYADSEFHALDKLVRQDMDIASSPLGDSELDRVEGGLDISSDLLAAQAVMQISALQTMAQAGEGSVTENRVERTTSLVQVCGSQPCVQSANLATFSEI
jgi:predicted trehalose synthase